MLIFVKLFLILTGCPAISSFVDIISEHHIQWTWYSDMVPDFVKNPGLGSISKEGVSYYFQRNLTADKKKVKIHQDFEQEGHGIAVIYYRTKEYFFESLKDIIRSVTKEEHEDHKENHDTSFHWEPKFFVIWPEACKSMDAAKNVFIHQVAPLYSANLTVASDIYVIIPYLMDNRVELSVWETYSITNVSNIVHQFLPMDWYALTNKIQRRENFEGARLRCLAVDDETYVAESKFTNKTGELTFESGSAVDMLFYLKDGLQFTVEAVRGNFTQEDLDGRIEGGAVEMAEGLADLSITQTTMTASREKFIHFLHPTYLEGVNAFFIQPEASLYRDIYYRSFQKEVWLMLLFAWVILLMSMHVFAWIKSSVSESEDLRDREILNESFLWVLGSACQQGWHLQPISSSIRLIFLTGYLMGAVCFIAFSASIVSVLSVKSDPIKTIEDIFADSFAVYVNDNITVLELRDQIQEKEDENKNPIHVVDPSASLSRLLDSKSVLLTYSDQFYIEASSRFCDHIICEKFSTLLINRAPVRSAMMVQRNSPYSEYFNYQIIKMRERGLNFRYLAVYARDTQMRCVDFRTGHTQSLSLNDVQTAFFILIAGYLLSIIFLCCEIAVQYNKTMKERAVTLN